MQYLHFEAPPFPYYVTSGNAFYRPGDQHRRRSGIGYFDLIAVEKGTLYIEVLDNCYSLPECSVLIIPVKSAHCGWRFCDESTKFHWLHFDTNESFRLSDSSAQTRRHCTSTVTINNHDYYMDSVMPVFQLLDDAKHEQLLTLMARLESLSINKFTNAVSAMENSFTSFEKQAVFMQVLSMVAVSDDRSSSSGVASQAMQFIQMHYLEPLTLRTVSSAIQYHPTHIIRCMKKQYNCTPAKAILDLRLQRICSLLSTTSFSVSEISEITGFSSAAYLCKVFRTHMGMTPLEYRQKDPST